MARVRAGTHDQPADAGHHRRARRHAARPKLDPQWSRPCFWSNELPVVPLVFRGSAIGGYNWAILPDMSMRWYVLSSNDGVIIVDIEDSPGGASRQELLKTGTEIVDSLVFS